MKPVIVRGRTPEQWVAHYQEELVIAHAELVDARASGGIVATAEAQEYVDMIEERLCGWVRRTLTQ